MMGTATPATSSPARLAKVGAYSMNDGDCDNPLVIDCNEGNSRSVFHE